LKKEAYSISHIQSNPATTGSTRLKAEDSLKKSHLRVPEAHTATQVSLKKFLALRENKREIRGGRAREKGKVRKKKKREKGNICALVREKEEGKSENLCASGKRAQYSINSLFATSRCLSNQTTRTI